MFRSSVAMPAAHVPPRSAAASVAVVVALLAGCGQKGGLTLPTAPIVPAAAPRSVDQAAPAPAEPAGVASAPVR